MNKTLVGQKLYKTLENGSIYIIRVLRRQNETTYGCIDEKGKKLKITEEEMKQYTKLKPDGYVTFSIVNLDNNIKDVIVAVHRQKDVEQNIQIPYAVCRQSIMDVFSNQVRNSYITYIGVSVNIENIPEGVDYRMVLACNSVEYATMISVYLDDTLDEILSLLNKQEKFDMILNHLANNIKQERVFGYCKSLKQLLIENNFMYDFLRSFNIHQVDFTTIINNGYTLNPEQRVYLEDLLKIEMFETYVVKYTKEIDLNKIKRNHVLISDKNNDIYIIAYDKGEYLNRTYRDGIKDKRDQVAMMKFKRNNK